MLAIDTNPLLYEALSNHCIEVKLSNMRSAIATGSDPNELDGMKKHQIGRPLNCAVANEAGHDFIKENLPVVKLLLEAGADPRLRAYPTVPFPKVPTFGQSALDDCKQYLDGYEYRSGRGWIKEDFELMPFYKAAYREMKKVADRLDAEDAAQRQGDLLEKNGYDKNGSWFGWLKFW